MKVKVIELKRKIREHCNISAVTRKKLEEKVENIKRQIHIAAE